MSELLESKSFLQAFSNNKQNKDDILSNLNFNMRRILKEKFNKLSPADQLKEFNDFNIKYLENTLSFIANDSER